MENLDLIIARIEEEAGNKAKFILDDAKQQSLSLLKKSEDKAKISIENLEKDFSNKKALELERIKSSNLLKCRNIILKAKQESISYVIEKINEILSNLSNEYMTQYIKKTLNGRALKDEEHLIIPRKYEGIDINMPYILSDDIKTGFLIEKNGIFENYTLEAQIEVNKDEIESQIQKILY